MSMNRRTFILSTGLVAAAPAFASVLTTSPNAGSSGIAERCQFAIGPARDGGGGVRPSIQDQRMGASRGNGG